MNLILVGCEFAGKTTLANEIVEWSKRTLGRYSHFHDHFTIPSTELEGDAKEEYRRASPQIKEMFQRFMMQYHMSPDFYGNVDHHLMGFHIEEAVYAPLYYGYGGKDSQSSFRSQEGQRTQMARDMEEKILERAPNTVLTLLKAAPEVIRQRMRENPTTEEGEPTRGVVQEKDVEYVLQRFEEEFEWSLIENKIVVDTTSSTVEETLAQFLEKFEPYLTQADRQRMQ